MMKGYYEKLVTAIFISLMITYHAHAAVQEIRSKQDSMTRQIAIYGPKDVNGTLAGNGQLTNSYNYSPNGMNQAVDEMDSKAFIQPTLLDVNISQNPFQYSGEYQDLESGLYYQRARYYSPSIQRFIQRDSYNLLNRYNYADGNPILNVDPSGHMPKTGRHILNGFGLLGGILGLLFSGGSSLAFVSAAVGLASSGSGIIDEILNNKIFHDQMLDKASNILGYIALALDGAALLKGLSEGFKAYIEVKSSASQKINDFKQEKRITDGTYRDNKLTDYHKKVMKEVRYKIVRKGMRKGGSKAAKEAEGWAIRAKYRTALLNRLVGPYRDPPPLVSPLFRGGIDVERDQSRHAESFIFDSIHSAKTADI